jgi:integrase
LEAGGLYTSEAPSSALAARVTRAAREGLDDNPALTSSWPRGGRCPARCSIRSRPGVSWPITKRGKRSRAILELLYGTGLRVGECERLDLAYVNLGQGVLFIVVPELMVPTPGGQKTARFVDVAGRDPATKRVVEMHQVGKQTKAGAPISRERRAIDDIKNACGGSEPCFHPYNEK